MPDKKPAPKSPDRKAVEALQSVIKKSAASKPKPKADEDPGPEPISNIHSVSDAYRIGKDRLSRAFFGPPKRADK